MTNILFVLSYPCSFFGHQVFDITGGDFPKQEIGLYYNKTQIQPNIQTHIQTHKKIQTKSSMPHSGADFLEQPPSCHQLLRQHPHLCFQGSPIPYIYQQCHLQRRRKIFRSQSGTGLKFFMHFGQNLNPAGFQVSSDLGLHLLRAPPETGQGSADGAVYGQVAMNKIERQSTKNYLIILLFLNIF